jgi:hypothetical protein
MANPTTPDLLAAFAEAPELPPGAIERDLVDATRRLAASSLPGFTQAQLGEALMHLVPIVNALTDKIHEADPLLDWESIAAVTVNVVGVAGMELYQAATTAFLAAVDAEEAAQDDRDADRSAS